MEQKKTDFNSIIGFVLLGAIALWWMYSNQPTPEELEQQKTERIQDSINAIQKATPVTITNKAPVEVVSDSIAKVQAQNELGAFAQSANVDATATTVIENDLVKLTIANKGGQIVEAHLKEFNEYHGDPVKLIKENNASFNINFGTTDNRILNTIDLNFEPTLTQNGDNQILSMKLKVDSNRYLEYRYELKPDDYMIDFAVRSNGLGNVINSSNDINLEWDLTAFRNEKSMRSESMYSWFYYKEKGNKVDYLSQDDTDVNNELNWVAYKQHFFTSILMTDTPFTKANIVSEKLYEDADIDTVYTHKYSLNTPLELKSGELNYAMNWYYGPVDYQLLKTYEGTQLDEVADMGWGIFGWINKYVFVYIFSFLASFSLNYGLVIILMTIAVRILMSPLVYKSYVSSAKMKVIRPEMEEINKKYPGKENAMKRQQETMAVQRKAGVSMMSGCIPALLQMPVFFALFRFFPSNLELRGKSFLWADDLSSYDNIFNLGFSIPFYGSHVSLFPILASVAIFFYMKMNQSQQMNMQAPAQEGMPDMQKMMKMMIYFSPIMMLFFFNQYASSLSLYYFVSNLLTIAIMLVIKNFVIDEAKIHAQIEENKKKPEKKKSGFRQRLDNAMKQAQAQQEAQKKGKK
ncbi:membrane protein insertase YidC [Urechidicola vernalis]|uniref:Membrane protein insertase YidC n=1 Tax=Urechidicola vernalis TaxID=3075600 RepID=A0ABU2Y823_9FLAO|nr:membrane protein insertase YidC [Urechidicola sp. P050]MDT0553862.1 membrane protein insertase YidC [Urechidicola sp. P050]